MMGTGPLVFRIHAIKRMFQRRISKEDVQEVLETGETIETYPDDKPYSSRLGGMLVHSISWLLRMRNLEKQS